MPLNYERLLALTFPAREFTYTERDTMLYALAVGMGRKMPDDLAFVFERDLQALPTQATVIAWEDTWQEQTGMDIAKVVHGEQRVTLHRPLAPSGRVRSEFRIAEVFDKGLGRGAVLLAETTLFDATDDQKIATLVSSVFARGDGGFGGPTGRPAAPHTIPERAPDGIFEMAVRPEQAMYYRLCGDRNPLHVDPAFARDAGFDQPILHGLCSWGMTAAAIVREVCHGEAARMQHFEARFTAPVYPGETLEVLLWIDGETVSFRTQAAERNVVVLDHGLAQLTSDTHNVNIFDGKQVTV
jgi:acyl dehydratase